MTQAQPQINEAERNALAVSYDIGETHIDLNPEIVCKYMVTGRADLVTMPEVIRFMHSCKAQGLNPLANGEAYLVKYSPQQPAQMVIGKGAYTKRAFNNPCYLGMENGIVTQIGDKIAHKEGCCLYPKEILLGGWCRVHTIRNGRESEIYREVSMTEYSKGQSTWKQMPATMINKVAIVQALRDAFPDEYCGLYSEEELQASGAIPSANKDMAAYVVEVVEDTVTQEDTQALILKAIEAYGKEEMPTKLKEKIQAYGYEHTKQITKTDFDKLMIELEEIAQNRKG